MESSSGAEIGLGVEAAAEVDQGLAVVEALLVEEAVDAGLDAALEGIEGEAGHDDGESGPQMPKSGRRVWTSSAATATTPK